MSNKEWKLHQTEREVLVEAIEKSEKTIVDNKSPKFDLKDSSEENTSDQEDFQFQNVKGTPKLNIKNVSIFSSKVLPHRVLLDCSIRIAIQFGGLDCQSSFPLLFKSKISELFYQEIKFSQCIMHHAPTMKPSYFLSNF